MTTPLGDPAYRYGVDDVIRAARTITPATELEADQVYGHAIGSKALPTGYVVRALARCNQLDTFRMAACDWSERVEVRYERVQAMTRVKLARHFQAAHPYLSRGQIGQLVAVIQFNFRDWGR